MNKWRLELMKSFFGYLSVLERSLTPFSKIPRCVQLATPDDFSAIRNVVAKSLDLKDSDLPNPKGEFVDELEIGDLTDAIPSTTLRMFPPGDINPEMPLSIELRVKWASELIRAMERVALVK